MRNLLHSVIRVVLVPFAALALTTPQDVERQDGRSLSSPIRSLGPTFVQNLGQWDAQAQFLAQSPGMNLWITEDGAVFDFHKTESPQRSAPDTQHSAKRKGHVVRMEFVGGTRVAPRGEVLLVGRHNYFLGTDSNKWVSNIPLFGEVTSQRVYDGIDARWYFDRGSPRYDLIIGPGSDPSRIAMRYEGADNVSVKQGKLALDTTLGRVEHTELFAYQVVGNQKRAIECEMRTQGNVVRFAVGSYDRTLPLVIDPLVNCTYLGGAVDDTAVDHDFDSEGAHVVAGMTNAAPFPTSLGVYQAPAVPNGYVSKVQPNGTALIWRSVFGGDALDQATGVAVMSNDSVVVCGITASANFPTLKALDAELGGPRDAFLLRLTPDGTSLVFATYWGGSSFELCGGVEVDSNDRVVFAGMTQSADFPTSVDCLDSTLGGGSDAFVSKLSMNGQNVLFSTYLGGSALETGYELALDSTNKIVLVGSTTSTDFPATAGAFDTTYNGNTDAFICKLNADGSGIRWATYWGGSDIEEVYDVAIDHLDGVGVAGFTLSSDFPVTPGAFRTPPGGYKGIAAKFTAGGKVVFSTGIGGSQSEAANACAFDSAGRLIVVGITISYDFHTTVGCFDQKLSGTSDAFVIKINGTGTKLLYGSYFGGPSADRFEAVSVDALGRVVAMGTTAGGVPLAADFGSIPNGGHGAFLARFVVDTPFISATPRTVISGPETITGRVALLLPAPAGGVTVEMFTSDSHLFAPTSALIAEGTKGKNVTLTTFSVDVQTEAMFGAKRPGSPEEWIEVYLEPGGLQSVALGRNTVRGGGSTTGTVKLSAAAPSGTPRTILLASSLPSVTVPASVDVAALQTTANFSVTTSPVAVRRLATISARLGGDTKTATLTINP